MKNLTMFNFNIGNIGIRLSLQGFSLIGDKAGASTHSHPEFEYHFVMSGNATIKFDDTEIFISENNAILICPDTFHKFSKTDKETSILSLSFDVKKNKYGIDYYNKIQPKLTKNNYILLKNNPLITDLIHTIISTIYSKNLFVLEEMRARITLLFTDIFFNLSDSEGYIKQQLITQEYDTRTYIIEEYFNEHYMEKISLKDLSERLYLSEQQTNRMVQKIYGEHFNQRLIKVRIKSAMELLLESQKTIIEISELVGYDSYVGFYQAFKKTTGISPEEWRNNNSSEKQFNS